ncbi:MAG: diguanylate cyclase [Acidobacteria bacterium]|nr:diguanylate cyclase [Acidobacteriota bacterium]MCA1642727.1 diguanylate cyclase [Acidobacteriota bacterium]
MLSLYQALISQHPRQLSPMRCAEQTIAQLHRYFEDVVLENNLAALVIESLPVKAERPQRALEHIMSIGRSARHAFFFAAPDDDLRNLPLRRAKEGVRQLVLLDRTAQERWEEHFVIIADARFSAILVSLRDKDAEGSDSASGSEVVWTFEPDIVYSALEYLMARVTAERLPQTEEFAGAVRTCMPKATSLQLTVSVTTKLARLLQEQAAREVAVNRIASAIRSSLELPSILQTTVNEVGNALGAQHCALRVDGELEQPPTNNYYFRDGKPDESAVDEVVNDLNAYHTRLSRKHKSFVQDGRDQANAEGQDETRPVAVVPLVYQLRFMGALMVRSDDSKRIWQESELLLLRTVADQVAVAVNHARLYEKQQQLALTDSLTGCVNRRSFEMQLERDLRLATRMRQPVSLIMLDIDHFKRVNDTHGHDAGDAALRFLADVLRDELRGVDTAARYGGEEFAVILPQANLEGALIVAERLRARLESTDIPGIGRITASFGIATFPLHANSRNQLVSAADRALYEAKREGRNRVRTPDTEPREVSDEMFDVVRETPMNEAETNAAAPVV